MATAIAYVALGANLGDPIASVRAAIESLRGMPHASLLATSSLYRSAPVGLRHQPDFINAVAVLAVDAAILQAPAFLGQLFAIEAACGRVRSVKNAPRTLDLDLLLFGDVCCDQPGLTLPHPRMAERAFVLAPLAEIAPELAIPACGRVIDLLARITDQRIERLTQIDQLYAPASASAPTP